MAALWIAADLADEVPLPTPDAMRAAIVEQLSFMDGVTHRQQCRGTKIVPFSLHNVDEVLADLGLNIPARVRAAHWLIPVKPSAYRHLTPTLPRRLHHRTPEPTTTR